MKKLFPTDKKFGPFWKYFLEITMEIQGLFLWKIGILYQSFELFFGFSNLGTNLGTIPRLENFFLHFFNFFH